MNRYENKLTVIRGFAALLVVTVHFSQTYELKKNSPKIDNFLDLGKHGVAIFFVLSAYLLTTSLQSLRTSWRNYRTYIMRRLRRIYPAYFVCLLVLVLCYKSDLKQIISHLFLVNNISSTYFGGINYPFWSIPIEFSFYLILPILIWKRYILLSKSTFTLALICGPIWQFFGGILRAKYNFDSNLDWSSRLYLITALPAFLIGIYAGNNNLHTKFTRGILLIARIFAIVEIIIRAFSIVIDSLHATTKIIDIPMHGSFGYLCYGALAERLIRSNNVKLFNNSLLINIGVISYSIYLWHLPIMQFVHSNLKSIFLSLLMSIISIFFVSALSFNLVEKRFIKHK